MRYFILYLGILIQLAIILFLVAIDRNLHDGGRWADIGWKIYDYGLIEIFTLFFICTAIAVFFIKRSDRMIRALLLLLSIVGIFVCMKTNLFAV
jgi:hypothetical protein